MTLGLLFAMIVIINVVFFILNYRRGPQAPAGNWAWGGDLINFILIILLGWQVFGPLLHR